MNWPRLGCAVGAAMVAGAATAMIPATAPWWSLIAAGALVSTYLLTR